MVKLQITVAIFALILGAVSCTKKSDRHSTDEPILIGQFGSMTGPESTFGRGTHRGVQLAMDEVNESGGINGRKINLITRDDQGKIDVTERVVTELIQKEKVVALLGEVASKLSLAAAPIAQQHKIPMISPSSTAPAVTAVGSHIFRVCFIDSFQGHVMAKFAHDKLKLKNVAVLKDGDSDYSKGLAEYFIKTFEKLGGSIVADQNYKSGDIDFKDQLIHIRGNKPDGIFIPGYYSEVGLIARQIRQLGIEATLLGGDGWDSPQLFEIGRTAINGGFFSNHFNVESTDPNVQSFVKKYRKKYNGEAPDSLAAGGYDAAMILFDAMKRANKINPAEIRSALASTRNFPGATGKISINENRNAIKPAVVVRVDGLTMRYVTTVHP